MVKCYRQIISTLIVFFLVRDVTCNYTFDTKYADIQIDHFSYVRNDTFKLKYLINDTFWSDSGPIFFYTGNEGNIEFFAQNTGFMIEQAAKFKALIVFCEHRYYGSSLPFGDLSYTSPKYLGYLSSEQALHDFVDVIDILQNSKYGEDGPLPVIAFGGSYGGMLAAWLRIKYPHIVLGAISSSAPVLQFTGVTPCETFNSIVTAIFSSNSDRFDCSEPIRKLWPAIRRVTKTSDGMSWLSTTWQLCKNITNGDDIKKLIDDVSNAIVDITMANYPYSTQFLSDLPPHPVNAICRKLKDYKTYVKDDKKLIGALGDALNIYTNYSGKAKCNDFSETDSLGTKGWDFQSCTEMVMPMCSKGNSIFELSPWNFETYSQDCLKKFGVKPMNPKEVILQYGARKLKYASNIVFSNGLLDPWSGGGVLNNISRTVTSIVILDGAHHLDLRASNPADPSSVIQARKYHSSMIEKWLRRFDEERNETGDFHQVIRI